MATATIGRPPSPEPSAVVITSSGAGPLGGASMRSVNPRTSTLAPKDARGNDPYGRGWLYFDNPGYVSELEKLEQLTDPQVAAMLHLRRSWVLIDGVQINPTEGVQPMTQAYIPNKKYEYAVEAAELCRWMLCNTSDSFHTTLMQWQGADFCRHVASDLIWRDQEWGDYKGKLLLDRMPAYAPCDYIVWRKEGRVIGLQPVNNGAPSLLDGKPAVYPIEKFALYMFRPDTRFPVGQDLASVIQIPHYMKREGQPARLENMAQFASPYVWSTAPEDNVEVKIPTGLYDQYGAPMYVKDAQGNEIKAPPQVAMARQMSAYKANGWGVLPGTAKIGLLEAQGDGRLFSNFSDDQDWQIALGILGIPTLVQSQEFGAGAKSSTDFELASIPVGSDRTATADVIKKSMCVPAVHYNLPEKYWDVIPTVTCGDRAAKLWVDLLKASINSFPGEQMPEFIGELARRSGVTDSDFRRVSGMIERGEPLPGTVAGSTPAAGATAGTTT